MMTFHHFKKKIRSAGFTLIEMMIVAGIFAVLTGIIIFRYGDFNSSILVSNMAYEVALTARQAQVYGLGARGFEGDTLSFDRPYGLFINMNDNTGTIEGQTKRFMLFVDRDAVGAQGYGECNELGGTGICSCNNDECLELLTMQRNIAITDIRIRQTLSESCEPVSFNNVAVTFKRPNPEAKIIVLDPPGYGGDRGFVEIEVSGQRAIDKAYVLIRSTGQITVSKNSICAAGGGGGGGGGSND